MDRNRQKQTEMDRNGQKQTESYLVCLFIHRARSRSALVNGGDGQNHNQAKNNGDS